jgi:cation diffusion facilitator family transporter
MADRTHSIDDHGHDHAYLGDDHDANARRMRIVLGLTLVTMVAEVVGGWAYGSLALLADGVHMASDAGALAIAAMAYRYSRRHLNDPRFTFGTGKVGHLAGFASALVLGIVSVAIGVESVGRLLAPAPVRFGEAALVATVGLVVNLFGAWLLGGHGHAHGHHDHADHDHKHGHSHGHGDANLRAAYLHVLGDALTSVLAIAALLAGRAFGWLWADAVAGLIGALVIARWSVKMMRETFWVLVDATDPATLARVRAAIEGPGDATVADLHVWQVGPSAQAAIVSVVADRPLTPDAYRQRLSGMAGLSHISVEVSACAHRHD